MHLCAFMSFNKNFMGFCVDIIIMCLMLSYTNKNKNKHASCIFLLKSILLSSIGLSYNLK